MSRRPASGTALQRRSRMSPGGRMWAESPVQTVGGFGRGNPVASTVCGVPPPLFLPTAEDDWSLVPHLGAGSTGMKTVTTDYLKYTINGDGSGVLGDGWAQDLGIRYDPTGRGIFGEWDFLAPGSPWEGFVVKVEHASRTGGIVGSNVGGWTQTGTPGPARIWTINSTHHVTQFGIDSEGWVVCQYRTGGTQICVDMLYVNSTGRDVKVSFLRGTDPDQDVYGGGYYDTYNYRGWGGESVTNSAAGWGVKSDFVMEIRTTGDGYQHNAGIVSDWPCDYFSSVDYVLSGPYDGGSSYVDNAICVAWDVGTVPPGGYAAVSCAYLFSVKN